MTLENAKALSKVFDGQEEPSQESMAQEHAELLFEPAYDKGNVSPDRYWADMTEAEAASHNHAEECDTPAAPAKDGPKDHKTKTVENSQVKITESDLGQHRSQCSGEFFTLGASLLDIDGWSEARLIKQRKCIRTIIIPMIKEGGCKSRLSDWEKILAHVSSRLGKGPKPS